MTRHVADSIAALDWRDDRVVLDGIVLRLQTAITDPALETESLALFKSRSLMDEYRRFYSARPDFAPRRIFELGIWDGGSTALWYDLLRPDKLVAIDAASRDDDPLFARFIASRDAAGRIETHWRTDQRDASRLRELAARFDGPLDLVIDDASHSYDPTRRSFETLFPFLRRGGIYVIEDWAWAHMPEYRAPDHPWRRKIPLTRFVHDLVELQGSAPGLVAEVTINHEFVAVERGADAIDLVGFTLDEHIARSE